MCKTNRVYCEDCEQWENLSLPSDQILEQQGCNQWSFDSNHPVRPQKIYGNYKVLNKDGKCPHFVGKREGLGIISDREML